MWRGWTAPENAVSPVLEPRAPALLTRYEELPDRARAYIEELAQRLSLPVSIISTGSGREQSIMLRDPFAVRS